MKEKEAQVDWDSYWVLGMVDSPQLQKPPCKEGGQQQEE